MTPGKYIWHNKHQDQPVTVTRVLGKGSDGRTYAQIEGTNTGVPTDELTPVQNPQSYSFKAFLKSLLRL